MNTQTAAINAAQRLITLMAQFEALSDGVDSYMKNYNQNTWDTFWSQMATVATAADGSPGQTNDGTPNTAHPINLPASPGTPILVSRNNLINGITLMQKFQTFMSQAGGTVAMSAQSNIQTASLITG